MTVGQRRPVVVTLDSSSSNDDPSRQHDLYNSDHSLSSSGSQSIVYAEMDTLVAQAESLPRRSSKRDSRSTPSSVREISPLDKRASKYTYAADGSSPYRVTKKTTNRKGRYKPKDAADHGSSVSTSDIISRHIQIAKADAEVICADYARQSKERIDNFREQAKRPSSASKQSSGDPSPFMHAVAEQQDRLASLDKIVQQVSSVSHAFCQSLQSDARRDDESVRRIASEHEAAVKLARETSIAQIERVLDADRIKRALLYLFAEI